MAMPALRFEEEYSVEERVARLEAHVEHIQSDVTEIKGDIRRLDAKIDRIDAKMDAGFQRLDANSESDLKWIMGVFGAGVLFLAGFMYFLVGRPSMAVIEPKTKDVSPIYAPAPVPGGRPSGQALPQ